MIATEIARMALAVACTGVISNALPTDRRGFAALVAVVVLIFTLG